MKGEIVNMWQRDTTTNRRVKIIDAAHIAHRYYFGKAKRLSATISIDEGGSKRLETIDTTIPNYLIKQVHRWANKGENPTAICFDSRGNAVGRKAYFASVTGITPKGEAIGYKGTRNARTAQFYDGLTVTMNVMRRAGLSVYVADNFEADDLIKACVDAAKKNYPGLPIDIITSDCDLLPLVDEQVSVFLHDTKTTYAVSPELETNHYVQYTPENFQQRCELKASFRGLLVPYNTVLLAKLLRGDKSDAIAGCKGWTPKRYNDLVQQMLDDGVDMGSIFRYGTPTVQYRYRGTTTLVPNALVATTPREEMDVVYGDPVELGKILETLSKYLNNEELAHVRFVYNGINLNSAFLQAPDGRDLPAECRRVPAKLKTPISSYFDGRLQGELSRLYINL